MEAVMVARENGKFVSVEPAPDPNVEITMLMDVRDNDRNGWGCGKGSVQTFPRERAVNWVLRGFADPKGWSLTPEEIKTHGLIALADIEQEIRSRGGKIEDAVKIPKYRKRLERLLTLVEGGSK
jgi:hypothetical protein